MFLWSDFAGIYLVSCSGFWFLYIAVELGVNESGCLKCWVNQRFPFDSSVRGFWSLLQSAPVCMFSVRQLFWSLFDEAIKGRFSLVLNCQMDVFIISKHIRWQFFSYSWYCNKSLGWNQVELFTLSLLSLIVDSWRLHQPYCTELWHGHGCTQSLHLHILPLGRFNFPEP